MFEDATKKFNLMCLVIESLTEVVDINVDA